MTERQGIVLDKPSGSFKYPRNLPLPHHHFAVNVKQCFNPPFLDLSRFSIQSPNGFALSGTANILGPEIEIELAVVVSGLCKSGAVERTVDVMQVCIESTGIHFKCPWCVYYGVAINT